MKCFKSFRGYQLRDLEVSDKPYVLNYCKCGGDIVEVDELIAPTIIELNKKGWTTLYCCSGHMNEEIISSYIKFEHMPNILPIGFERKGESIYQKDRHRSLTGIKGYNQLLRINTNLYKWALSLPQKPTQKDGI